MLEARGNRPHKWSAYFLRRRHRVSRMEANTPQPIRLWAAADSTVDSLNSSVDARSAAKESAKKSVAELYSEPLCYGPAPEAEDGVKAWVQDHDGCFGLYINGKWLHPGGRKTYVSTNPSNNEPLAETTQASEEDIDLAVASARKAFDSWSATSGHHRARVLYAIARHVQKHARLLAVVESMDNGKPIRETRDADVPLVARHFYYYAGWAQLMETELSGYQPVGVIGQVIPWNFPLLMLAWKIAPALAMGNTIVLKPATYTRMSALLFAEICHEAGVPPGVVNIVTGSGRIGGYLVEHPAVDKVAFTGSTDVGRTIRRAIAGSGKKISLELGGKSPVVVFESADLDSAVEGVVDAIWFNQGEVCCAGSRLLVQESVAERFFHKLRRRMQTLRVGSSTDKCVDVGALVDKSQVESISGFVERAKATGAEVFHACEVPSDGQFYPPTLITNVEPVSECVIEEIFGPVLVAMTFRTPKEAVALANNTRFGLGGSVWTENVNLALETAVQIKAGVVWVNAHNMFDAAGGFGGYRESGFGREGGKEGLFEYVRPKWQARPQPASFSKDDAWGTPGHTEAHPRPERGDGDQVASGDGLPSLGGLSLKIDRTPKMYIGGAQKRPDAPYSRDVRSPSGVVVGQVGDGNRKDIRNAVEAAHAAAGGWGKRAAYNRAQIMFFIAENLDARFDEFAGRIAAQTGRSLESAQNEVHCAISRLFTYASWADKYGGTIQETTLYGVTAQINEPVGVIGMLCPDEYPLLGFISLLAPAVVRGNTVVIVPSEKYPLSATDLYQVFDTSDLPNGVVNIVTGRRDHLAKSLVTHQDVDSVWYFGSALGSYHCEYLASDNMKRTFVNYGLTRDWESREQGEGHEFLHEAVEVKNIWIPMGV